MVAMDRYPGVYILASKRNGTLYTGVTSNLPSGFGGISKARCLSFTNKYGVHVLVWCEMHETMAAAITREKQIKQWKRAWKLELIEAGNPEWRDLYDEVCR